MFVPGKPFQPSLVFAGKAGAYPSGATYKILIIIFGYGVHYCKSSQGFSGQPFVVNAPWPCKKYKKRVLDQNKSSLLLKIILYNTQALQLFSINKVN